MADYKAPTGNLVTFSFFPVTTSVPAGSSLSFNWSTSSVSYVIPDPQGVNFLFIRKCDEGVKYNTVDFELKEFSQPTSSLSATLGNVTGRFITVDVVKTTIKLTLANLVPSISVYKAPAWTVAFNQTLANISFPISLRTPIRISGTWSGTFAAVTTSISLNYVSTRFASTLADVTTAIIGRVPVPISVTFSNTLSNCTTAIIAKAYHGTLSTTTAACTTSISIRVPVPIDGTFSKTLFNTTGIFTALHYAATWSKTLASCTLTGSGIVPLPISGTLARVLGDATLRIQTIFTGVQGTLSGTFTNAWVTIRGGITDSGTLSSSLLPLTSTIQLRTPIWEYVTLSLNTAYVQSSITGKQWPTGSLSRTLANATVAIVATLPVPITATWFSYTGLLVPTLRIGAWPAGNLNRTLANCSTSISARTPIWIYTTLAPVSSTVLTTITGRVLIGGYLSKTLESIYISWYLNFQLPRAGSINVTLFMSGLIYAKTMNYGTFDVTLKNVSPTLAIRVPIRIYVTFNITFATFTTVYIRGKVPMFGNLEFTWFDLQPRITGRVLIGLTLHSTLANNSSRIYIQVPVPTSISLTPTMGNVTSMIQGTGHSRLVLSKTLDATTGRFVLQSTSIGVIINLTKFDGPFISINRFYSGIMGELFPIRSGKFWKMEIFGNNGDATVTTFAKIKLLKEIENGSMVNVLEGVSAAQNFSAPNTEYSSPDGMTWEYTLPEDTEIRAYEIEGI